MTVVDGQLTRPALRVMLPNTGMFLSLMLTEISSVSEQYLAETSVTPRGRHLDNAPWSTCTSWPFFVIGRPWHLNGEIPEPVKSKSPFSVTSLVPVVREHAVQRIAHGDHVRQTIPRRIARREPRGRRRQAGGRPLPPLVCDKVDAERQKPLALALSRPLPAVKGA